jgi:hypothetical protein
MISINCGQNSKQQKQKIVPDLRALENEQNRHSGGGMSTHGQRRWHRMNFCCVALTKCR